MHITNSRRIGGLSRDSHIEASTVASGLDWPATVPYAFRLAASWKRFRVYAAIEINFWKGCKQSLRISTSGRTCRLLLHALISQVIAWIIISGVRSRLFLVRRLFRLRSDNCLKLPLVQLFQNFFLKLFFGRSSECF